MYKVEKENYLPESLFAGSFPVEVEIAKTKGKIEKNTVVVLSEGTIAEVTPENIKDIYGITADGTEEAGSVAVYLTGTFRAEAVKFGKSDLKTVKVPLRNIGIFLK